MINEAIKAGVKHIVLASVDRGGAGRREENLTKIPHSARKYRIERLPRARTSETKAGCTFLRPVVFMDNLTTDFSGKLFTSLWRGLGDKPLQFNSTYDIGAFAFRVIADPDAYNGKAISLAGDEFTFAQAKKVFGATLGYDIPVIFDVLGNTAKYFVKELEVRISWFAEPEFGADDQKLRREEPKLQNLVRWRRGVGLRGSSSQLASLDQILSDISYGIHGNI